MSQTIVHTTFLYIELVGTSPSQKTNCYRVFNKDNLEESIGEIKWFGRWRQYCFFPFSDTVFEKTCLQDLSQYLRELNESHHAKKEEFS